MLCKRTLFLFLLLSGFLATQSVNAQVQTTRKYRVVAYKNGEPTVFSISNEAEIVPPMALYVPNTFTPNGDGMNDSFGVAGEAIQEFSMQVFNRWGQKVFETADANYRWDGSYQGQKAPEGSYVYKLSAKGVDGKRVSKEGHVNLIF